MSVRSRPVVISTRVSDDNRALIRALADLKGISVSEAVHEVLIQAVRNRLAEIVAASDEEAPADPRDSLHRPCP
jgi:hypothetical protein